MPTSTTGTSRTPFAGNIIPQSRWSKISSNILPFIPPQNLPGITGNYTYTNLTTIDDYIWSIKVDHAITGKNRPGSARQNSQHSRKKTPDVYSYDCPAP